MKNKIIRTALAVFLAACAMCSFAASQPGEPSSRIPNPPPYYGKIAQRLVSMLQHYHVLQKRLDDAVYAQAWTNLVSYYDFDHSVFLQSDLDALAERLPLLRSEIAKGDVSFGYDVFKLYRQRIAERIAYATNLLAKAQWDFSVDETYRVKRKDAPWPKTREEAEDHWRRRMKNEVLAAMLSRELAAEKKAAKESAKPAKTGEETSGKVLSPEENLIKKYRQYHIAIADPDEEAILQAYMSAICRALDPHTDYMSPVSRDEFEIEMSLSLSGVGAELTMDDGALKITRVTPGGPLDVDGRVKAGDKIVGVRQAGGEMEDIMWQPMKKSIRKIRGKKGTKVTLDIIPRSDPSGATHKLIELVRDEIKLDEQAATGHVERVSRDGVDKKIGYVYLPGFYGTMDKRPGEPGYLSCAADVGKYVASFNAEGVEGLILDLRGNGGGSLKEAVSLSALFVQSGPVVVVKDTGRSVPLPIPPGNPVAFRKPVIVLIDRASASASEIVAAHLRDTGRAIVLGDVRSHGKGTVQSVMGMGPETFGSMKITTARFYRVNGRSTQVRGIEADIHLPSFLDSLDIGEDKLPNALPFTRLKGYAARKVWNLDTYIPELSKLSTARTAGDEAFARHLADVAATKEIYEREEVPLERTARKAMVKRDQELSERAFEGGGEEDGENGKADDAKAADEANASPEDAEARMLMRRKRGRKAGVGEDDVVLKEAFEVMCDLLKLNGGEQLPQQAPQDWYNGILGF